VINHLRSRMCWTVFVVVSATLATLTLFDDLLFSSGHFTMQVAASASSAVKFDFDGDGKADVSRWQVSGNALRVRNSNGGSNTDYTVGPYGAKIAPGDYNGGGVTDAAVFKDGTWTYKISPSATPQTISLGTTGDTPVAADYDGDSITDAAVYRPSTSVWYVRKSSTSTTVTYTWGQTGDIPVVGDYDDDGKSDIAVWRPSTGYWYIIRSSNGTSFTNQWGVGATDIPISGDYDGDGQTEIAVFRRTTGVWYFKYSSTGYTTWQTQSWGNVGDQPVPADYDGDGKDDFAVWRPTTGVWWLVQSGSNYSIQTYTLGEANDRAVPAAYLKQVGGSVLTDEVAAARLSPRNATGATNLYSQNFSWGRSLFSLPGRAGHDLSLGIGYNSLVWTRVGEELHFDADRGNAGPGFRLGFPVIEPVYYDGAKAKFAYMMVTPSGARIEFRETTVSGVYETADSNYAQLTTTGAANPNDPVDPITITVTTTDGTQMTYDWEPALDRFVCEQIKDRNGNFISITYNATANRDEITDTLGRLVKINYDTEGYPVSITQDWKATNGTGTTDPKTWASFTYTTKAINTNYDALNVVGPLNGYAVKVLDKITYLDGSSTKFHYNGYGQAYIVEKIAADLSTHILNTTEINLSSPTISTDVPRFTSTSTTVENFNGGSPVTVTNTDPAAAANYTLPGSLSINSSVVKVGVTGHPDQLYSRIHFAPSEWKEGLTLATEDCTGTDSTCTTRKRWTWTDYTQDNTGLSYILNPRATETRVGDGTNTKKTTVSYHVIPETNTAIWGLPSIVTVYDTDLTTFLKRVETEYNWNSAYTDKRLVGLPSEVRSYGRETSGLNLMSKVTYAYDEGNFSDTALSQNISPTQHDSTNYSSTFIAGRGNPTSATRWNTESGKENNSAYAITSFVKYNTAGAAVSKTSPWDGTNTRTVKIGYADVWNDSVTRTTYGYPTTITDPANNSSTVKYRFDIGANVEATSPAPANQTHGKTTKRVFDTYGRLEKNSVYVDTTEKSYTRYEYPTNGVQSKIYATLVDVDNDTVISDDEAMTETFFDGAGRPLRTRAPHPGSTGLWSATKTTYDILGRVSSQSVPTEVSVSGDTWTPAGDDSAGYKLTYQKYDWMNRVVRKINTDGLDQTTYNDSDVVISYAGCGCAGGTVTTVEGENIVEKDWAGTTTTATHGRRKQKIYEDILGRTIKTESLKWGGTDVYSRTEVDYNGRDQAINVEVTDLDDPQNPVTQVTTTTFDGHGRLASRHIPQQDTSTATTYNYNPDDSILSVTDARGAVTGYEYNSRGLPVEISWTVPSQSGITDPADVTFAYDNLGNRTSITDGLGSVTYAYDSLSQLTAETRQFTDTLSAAPLANNSFKLEYTYHVGGGLKSLKDPYGQQINYSNDTAGRLTRVEGSASFGGVTTYAENPGYRAWGGLKSLQYGNSTSMSMTFNSRLQAEGFDLIKSGQSTPIISKDYSFYSDGAVRKIDDLVDNKFDQLRTYDNVGRPKTASSSYTARGETPDTNNQYNIPFVQSHIFNAFGNLTVRDHRHWNTNDFDFTHAYTNNRLTTGLYNLFDADGRQTKIQQNSDIIETQYDAAGRISFYHRYFAPAGEREITRQYDGDGREGKRETRNYTEVTEDNWQWGEWEAEYFIRSTVLGGKVVSDAGPDGSKKRTYVRAAGAEIAWQNGSGTGATVVFQHHDAAGSNYRTTKSDGTLFDDPYNEGAPAELDPMGTNSGTANPYLQQLPPGETCVGCEQINTEMPNYTFGQLLTETLDGFPISRSQAESLLDTGLAIPSALARYQHMPGFQFNSHGLGIFTHYIPGHYTGTSVRVAEDEDGTGGGSETGLQWHSPQWGTSYAEVNWKVSIRRRITELETSPSDPRKLTNLVSALDKCVRELFQVKVTSFTPSEHGKAGNVSFNFTDSNRRSAAGLMGFGVVNDVTRYSTRTAPEDIRNQVGKNERVTGFTTSSSPHVNYTLSDVTNWLTIVKTQVHELGHSLQFIMRNAVSGYPQYDEAGWKLENCVRDEGGFKY
jgi:YD repeat-containing protein